MSPCQWQTQRTNCTYENANFQDRRSLRVSSVTSSVSDHFGACQWPSFSNADFQPEQSQPKLDCPRRKTTKLGPALRKTWGQDNEWGDFYSLVQDLARFLFFQGNSELSSHQMMASKAQTKGTTGLCQNDFHLWCPTGSLGEVQGQVTGRYLGLLSL